MINAATVADYFVVVVVTASTTSDVFVDGVRVVDMFDFIRDVDNYLFVVATANGFAKKILENILEGIYVKNQFFRILYIFILIIANPKNL